MGLRDILRRWSTTEDDRAVERAVEESQMTPIERDIDRKDFEGRKDDLAAGSSRAGAAAEDAASDDLP